MIKDSSYYVTSCNRITRSSLSTGITVSGDYSVTFLPSIIAARITRQADNHVMGATLPSATESNFERYVSDEKLNPLLPRLSAPKL